jgi:hypothetical protein
MSLRRNTAAARNTWAFLLEDIGRGGSVGGGIVLSLWSGGFAMLHTIDKIYERAELSFRRIKTNLIKDNLLGAVGPGSRRVVSSVLDSTICEVWFCRGGAPRRQVALSAVVS